MSVVAVNAQVLFSNAGQETTCATLNGGPYDSIDVYVRASATLPIIFRLYAVVGALTSLVAEASYQSMAPEVLTWMRDNVSQRPIHAGGTSFILKALINQQLNPSTQLEVNITIAGVAAGDFATPSNVSGSVNLPSTDEVTITTASGYTQFADVAANLQNLPSRFEAVQAAYNVILYANCGAGSVEVPFAIETIGNTNIGDTNRRGVTNIFTQLALPIASQYRLAIAPVTFQAEGAPLTASLTTYSTASTSGTSGGGVFVSNITALRALITTSANVQLLGYYSSNDGGEGLFSYDPSSNITDDGGTVIKPDSIGIGQPGRWLRNYGLGLINALWFGLLGDAASDNDAAQARLVASGPVQRGQGIFYPAGEYVFPSTVGPFPLGSFVRGVGLQSHPGFGSSAIGTIFLCQDPNIGVQLGHDPSSNIASGSDIWGIQFVGDNAGGLNEVGVEILNDTEVTIRNCRFGAFKYQLSFDGCEVCKAENVYFDAVPRAGRGYPAASMSVDAGTASAFAVRFGSFHSMGGNLACNANVVELAEFNNTGWAIHHGGGVGNIVMESSGECTAGIAIMSTATIGTLHETLNFEGGSNSNYIIHDTHYDVTLRNVIGTVSIPFATILGPIYNFNLEDIFLRLNNSAFPIVGSSSILGGHCTGCSPPIGAGASTANVIFDSTDVRMVVDSGYGTDGPSFGIKCAPQSPLDVNDNRIRIRIALTPANSADPIGNIGDVAWDAGFVYVKTAAGWKRVATAAF